MIGENKEMRSSRFRWIVLGIAIVVLGCTELGMLLESDDWPDDLPTLDSTTAHIEAIFSACRGERPVAEATR